MGRYAKAGPYRPPTLRVVKTRGYSGRGDKLGKSGDGAAYAAPLQSP